MKHMFFPGIALIAAATLGTPVCAVDYTADPDHAQIWFAADHVGFSTVRGMFRQFDAQIDFDPDHPLESKARFVIVAASVDTNSALRDNGLRSDAFLDVDRYPTIVFETEDVSRLGEKEADITGRLTIRGVTREETFRARLRRAAVSELTGLRTAGFFVQGVIDRRDYGMTFGAPAIGVDISITLDMEIVEKM